MRKCYAVKQFALLTLGGLTFWLIRHKLSDYRHLNERRPRMSAKLKQNLRELSRSIEVNAPKVQAKPSASRAGSPDRAVTASVGKYFAALQRLSQE